MRRYSVNLPPRVLAGLRRHAAAVAPGECCGALMGDFGPVHVDIRAMVPVPSPAISATGSLIDADAVRRLERQAACAGVTVVGFYHSHSQSSASPPSELDVELAVPGYIYLIVEGPGGAVRGWQLRDDGTRFEELALPLAAGAA